MEPMEEDLMAELNHLKELDPNINDSDRQIITQNSQINQVHLIELPNGEYEIAACENHLGQEISNERFVFENNEVDENERNVRYLELNFEDSEGEEGEDQEEDPNNALMMDISEFGSEHRYQNDSEEEDDPSEDEDEKMEGEGQVAETPHAPETRAQLITLPQKPEIFTKPQDTKIYNFQSKPKNPNKSQWPNKIKEYSNTLTK